MPVSTIPYPTTTPTTTKPVYFWRPHEEGTGYLGQWYPSPFAVSGDTYATAEMWMMVSKARLFGDEKVAKEMLQTNDPKKTQGVGQEDKFEIVTKGNLHKFSLSEDAESFRKWLLATGERELVEASPMDRIWGVGFEERNAGANRHRWGQNLLGKALMEVRARLREDEVKGKTGTEGA